ncbi:MAG: hypothetical protein Q7J47_00135 [Azoarcus sp.]|nr:hypothetical protein [Azoarcus sp.]
MAIASFRGEKNVAEIADKLYVRLTPKQREKAEAALLKANPQLKDIGKLKPGTILRLPDLPELSAKTNRSLDNPDAQIAKLMSESVSSYARVLGERYKNDQESTHAQIALLGSAKLKKELGNAPALQKQADEARKALEARVKTVDVRQAAVDAAIKQALKDIEAQSSG